MTKIAKFAKIVTFLKIAKNAKIAEIADIAKIAIIAEIARITTVAEIADIATIDIIAEIAKIHMWLVGCPNPSKIEQCWECTFLNLYTRMKTKWASKFFSLFSLRGSS